MGTARGTTLSTSREVSLAWNLGRTCIGSLKPSFPITVRGAFTLQEK
jgi:hypothetical protein